MKTREELLISDSIVLDNLAHLLDCIIFLLVQVAQLLPQQLQVSFAFKKVILNQRLPFINCSQASVQFSYLLVLLLVALRQLRDQLLIKKLALKSMIRLYFLRNTLSANHLLLPLLCRQRSQQLRRVAAHGQRLGLFLFIKVLLLLLWAYSCIDKSWTFSSLGSFLLSTLSARISILHLKRLAIQLALRCQRLTLRRQRLPSVSAFDYLVAHASSALLSILFHLLNRRL